jgi:hypothetical protein
MCVIRQRPSAETSSRARASFSCSRLISSQLAASACLLGRPAQSFSRVGIEQGHPAQPVEARRLAVLEVRSEQLLAIWHRLVLRRVVRPATPVLVGN